MPMLASNYIPKGMTVHLQSENGIMGLVSLLSGLFLAIFGKCSWPKLGKNDRLNIKIGRN